MMCIVCVSRCEVDIWIDSKAAEDRRRIAEGWKRGIYRRLFYY